MNTRVKMLEEIKDPFKLSGKDVKILLEILKGLIIQVDAIADKLDDLGI